MRAYASVRPEDADAGQSEDAALLYSLQHQQQETASTLRLVRNLNVAVLVLLLVLLFVGWQSRNPSPPAWQPVQFVPPASSPSTANPPPANLSPANSRFSNAALLDRCRAEDIIGAKMNNRPLPDRACNQIQWLEPVMSSSDKEIIFRYVREARTYVEYGSGGSSNTVALLPERSMTIEHVVEWCNKVKQRPVVGRNMEVGRQRVKCIDIGLPMASFGNPICGSIPQEECAKRFLPYINTIDEFGEETIDVVFVDGRLRRACALKALKYLGPESFLIVHDNSRYEEDLLKFFDLHEKQDQVGVYRAKPEYIGNTELYLHFSWSVQK